MVLTRETGLSQVGREGSKGRQFYVHDVYIPGVRSSISINAS